MKYVIIGDLNARVGPKVDELITLNTHYCYQTPVDPIVNYNGKRTMNNLQMKGRCFPGLLTFRKGKKWISQIDLCIASEELAPCIHDLVINQDVSFPSNHALILVSFMFLEETTSLQKILNHSADIGCYPETVSTPQMCKRPINIHQIGPVSFYENIDAVNPALALTGDHNEIAKGFSDLLYNAITESRVPRPPSSRSYDPAATRWERIVNCEDASTLWKAIDWKGQFNPVPQDYEAQSSESQFQAHLEKLLNPSDNSALKTDLSNYHV